MLNLKFTNILEKFTKQFNINNAKDPLVSRFNFKNIFILLFTIIIISYILLDKGDFSLMSIIIYLISIAFYIIISHSFLRYFDSFLKDYEPNVISRSIIYNLIYCLVWIYFIILFII